MLYQIDWDKWTVEDTMCGKWTVGGKENINLRKGGQDKL